MVNNYGFTISYNYKGLKGRQRGGSVFRTKREAESYARQLNSEWRSVSGARAVKATKTEYDKHVRRQMNDIINSRKSRR